MASLQGMSQNMAADEAGGAREEIRIDLNEAGGLCPSLAEATDRVDLRLKHRHGQPWICTEEQGAVHDFI